MAGEWVVNYLRSSRGNYTRETLTTVLLAAGHSQTEIDDAMAFLEAEGSAPESNRLRLRPRDVLHGMVAGAAYVAGVLGLATALSRTGWPLDRGLLVVSTSVAGLVCWLVVRRRDPVVAGGLVAGVALALLIPLFLLIGFLALVSLDLATVT